MVHTLEKPKTDVSHKVVGVTPVMAKQWMDSNHKKQRMISEVKVDSYANDMIEGRWEFTGEPLIFDEKGDLMNGQHRLTAVIRSGCTIKFLIISGVEERAYNFIDIGRKRSPADVLHSNGIKLSKLAASIAVFCVNFPRRLPNGGRNSKKLASNQEVLDFTRKNLPHDFLLKIESWKKAFGKILPGSKIGAFCILFGQRDTDQADEFMRLLINGEELGKGSPILLLRNELIKNSLSDKKYNRVTLDALIIKAWNYYRLDKKPKTLKWVKSGKEGFPEII